MKVLNTPFSREYYLRAARRVVKSPGSSDADIFAACETLRAWGDWQDHQMADIVENAVRGRIQKSENIEYYKLAVWLFFGVAAWGVLAIMAVVIRKLIVG